MPAGWPGRGELWQVDIDGLTEYVVVISHDDHNAGPASTVTVLWTTTEYMVRFHHVPLSPRASGLSGSRYVQCEEIDTLEKEHFHKGQLIQVLDQQTMEQIEARLRVYLDLP